jgi:hypothetical protein
VLDFDGNELKHGDIVIIDKTAYLLRGILGRVYVVTRKNGITVWMLHTPSVEKKRIWKISDWLAHRCTVIGNYYDKTGEWDILFPDVEV